MKKPELLQIIQSLSLEQQREVLVRYIERSNEEQKWFLEKILSEVQAAGDGPDGRGQSIRIPQELLDEKMGQFREWLQEIEEGELALEASGYEDYSSGYWDSDWIWEYDDPNGIGEKLAAMIDFAGDCIQYGHYPEASEIFGELWGMEILADLEEDCHSLGLEEMVSEGLLHADLEKLALKALYAAYWAAKPGERAKKLYAYFGCSAFQGIRIQDCFQAGREQLPDLECFWEDWIRLLEGRSGDTEARLPEEAVDYYQGTEGLAEIAARNYDTHPTLALSVLQKYRKCASYTEMERFGIEALEHMNVKLNIRARIALAAAFAASRQGHEQQEYTCLLEAFRSDSNVRNLLRLYGNEQLAEGYGVRARELLPGGPAGKNIAFGGSRELQENIINDDTYNKLCFFFGEFENVKKKVVNPKGSLGWTGKFTRKGLALFLTYLYDGSRPTTAINYFLHRIDFGNGEEEFSTLLEEELEREAEKQGVSLFWSYFQRWKKYFPMEQEEKEKYYSWASKMIHARADAIVGGQFRNYYGESAALLVALGDIRGSWGDDAEKMRIQAEYKRKFPRHSSFQKEMREYLG